MMGYFISLFVVIMTVLNVLSSYGQDGDAGHSKVQSCEDKTVTMVPGEGLDIAIAALRARLKENPSLIQCRIRLGYLLLEKNANDEAMKEFAVALQDLPGSPVAKAGKGIALSQKGDLKAAEAVFKDALILNPDPMKVHYELGLVYEKMGDLDKALGEFREGINAYKKGRR